MARVPLAPQGVGRWEQGALAVTLGLGLLAHLSLGLGLLGQLTPLAMAAVVALLAALSWWRWPRLAPAEPILDVVEGRWRPALALLIVAFLVATALLSLHPPTQWDALSYHLPAARAMAQSGRVEPLPYLRYPVFPRHAELLLALGLLFGDEREAQLTEWLAMATCAVLVWAAGRQRFGARAGAWASALWLGSPLVLMLGASAYVDVLVALLSTALVLSVARAAEAEEDEPRLGALAGAFAGLCASTKYTGLVVAALWMVPLLLRRRWRALLGYALAFALLGLPWYLLDAHWAGNPLFPLARTQLGPDPFWNDADRLGQTADLHRYGLGRGPLDLLRLPFDLLLRPRAFHSEQIYAPLLLLGVPLVLPSLRRPAVRLLALCAGLYLLAWFWGVAQVPRYLMPIIPLAALLVGASLSALAEHLPAGRWRPVGLTLASLALVGAGPAWTVRELVLRGLPPSSPEDRAAWLTARVPPFAALAHLVPEGPGERLYQLQLEDTIWYAPPSVTVMGDWFGPARYQPILDSVGDPRALHSALKQHRADWLLVPRPSFRGALVLPEGDPEFAARFALRFDSPAAALYRVLPVADPARPDG